MEKWKLIDGLRSKELHQHVIFKLKDGAEFDAYDVDDFDDGLLMVGGCFDSGECGSGFILMIDEIETFEVI